MRNLAKRALGRRQHRVEPLRQLRWRQRFALDIWAFNQLGQRPGVPAVDHPVAHDGGRHPGHADGLEVTPALRLRFHVEPDEGDTP